MIVNRIPINPTQPIMNSRSTETITRAEPPVDNDSILGNSITVAERFSRRSRVLLSPISIIITVNNREQYLALAIASCLKQTRTDFELLIWDDGSSDRGLEIAQSFALKDARVRVVAAPHTGRGQALRDAIAASEGKYLGWVDSDDLLHPEAIAQTAAYLDSYPEVGMVYTQYLVIDEREQVKGLGKRCQIPYCKDRLLIDFMTFHFRLIRREVYESVGGINPEFGTIEDYDLCLRLSEVTEIQQLKKPLYLYRVHENSICATKQIEQIKLTEEAITRALQRRGLADSLELEVIVRPKFVLRRKGLGL